MKKTIITAILSMAATQGLVYGQESTPADSTRTKAPIELSEVEVKANSAWIDGDKAVFVPTKQAKNLAKNMTSLIDKMETSLLHVVDGQIKTSSGQDVHLYINGVAVDRIDNATFWAKNVLRVEFIPVPSDPKFIGQQNVLNFIMKEYDVGGLTRLSGDQTIPNNGDYSASSKLVWKKLTFNAEVNGGYERDFYSGDRQEETYRDIWYGGVKHDEVVRTSESTADMKSRNLNVGMNVRYRDDHLTATHGFSFSRNRNPGSTTSGSLDYTPDIIGGNTMESWSSAKNNSFTLNGDYLYLMSGYKWAFLGGWHVDYGRNRNLSTYTESPLSEIFNGNSEKTWGFGANFQVGRQLTPKMRIALQVEDNMTDFKTDYYGSTASRQSQRQNKASLKLEWVWVPKDNLSFSLKPDVSLFSRSLNDSIRQNDMLAGADFQTYYVINNRSSLFLSLYYALNAPAASMVNDLILRQTELKWIEGNPMIKPKSFYSLSLDYMLLPVNWFNLSVSGRMTINNNESALSYESGTQEYEGVIARYINGVTIRMYNAHCDIVFKPFDGKTRLTTTLDCTHYRADGVKSVWNFRPRFAFSYMVGDFSFVARCFGPEKFLRNAGSETHRTAWSYDFEAEYGNGNLIVGLTLNNIFNKHIHSTVSQYEKAYQSVSHRWEKGRSVNLSVVYTFDYGKKVDPGISVQSHSMGESSVLGN